MKLCTDISQSKALAEILPIESADMYYEKINEETFILKVGKDIATLLGKNITMLPNSFSYRYCYTIPCWSLAALLDVIPQEIFNGEYIINITEGCVSRWVLTYDHYENRNHSHYGLSSGADNLVDTCYETILKLHERELL